MKPSGNKGAVGFSFKYFESIFCVIVSHLASDQDEIKARNDDFREITKSLKFENLFEKTSKKVEGKV